jgi:hypothetical protein
MKLLGIISVDFDATYQLLIRYSAFVILERDSTSAIRVFEESL